MLKKVSIFTILIILLTAMAVWSPWDRLDLTYKSVLGIQEIEEFSALEVYSLKDEISVLIDGQKMGTVSPVDGVLLIPQIEVGSHVVDLKREGENSDLYYEISKSIDFSAGLNSVVAYEIGPSRLFSQGHIFYARGSNYDESVEFAKLNIETEEDQVTVYLNGAEIGESPISDFELALDRTYSIRLQKEGYEDLEFNILPQEQSDRDKLRNVDLFIEGSLFLIPY